MEREEDRFIFLLAPATAEGLAQLAASVNDHLALGYQVTGSVLTLSDGSLGQTMYLKGLTKSQRVLWDTIRAGFAEVEAGRVQPVSKRLDEVEAAGRLLNFYHVLNADGGLSGGVVTASCHAEAVQRATVLGQPPVNVRMATPAEAAALNTHGKEASERYT